VASPEDWRSKACDDAWGILGFKDVVIVTHGWHMRVKEQERGFISGEAVL
jgi:hypothetical protein